VGPLGHLPPDATILAVMPQPTDLTPADTASTLPPGLGRALQTRFGAAICMYSILPDSLEALASALAGTIAFAGRLPVAVPGFAR
jgi:hypothetical protein